MRLSKLVAPALLAPGLLVVGAVLLSGPTLDRRTDARLGRAWKSAEAAGFPLIASDLLPVGYNARDDFAAALNEWKAACASDLRLSNGVKEREDGDRQAPLQDYPYIRPHIAELARASSTKWFIGRSDPDDPYASAIRFQELAWAKRVVKVLSLAALEEARVGRWDEALRFLDSVKRIGDLVGQGPTLIRLLVAVAIEAIVVQACLDLLETKGAPQDLGARLAEHTLAEDLRIDLSMCLRGEAYMGVSWFRNSGKSVDLTEWSLLWPSEADLEKPPKPASPLQRDGWPLGQSQRSRMALHLEAWAPVLADLSRSTAGADDLDRVSFGIEEPVRSELGGSMRQVADGIRKAQAERRCARAVCLAVSFRSRSGRYPANLSEIAVADTDPFSGRPMGYRSGDGSVRVWSVGPDRQDQGGLSRRERAVGEDATRTDLVAAYPKLRRRPSGTHQP